MIIQRVFDDNSCERIYFSPYTDIKVSGNELYLRSPGKKRIRLQFRNPAEAFLSRMNAGMTYEEITNVLRNELMFHEYDLIQILEELHDKNLIIFKIWHILVL